MLKVKKTLKILLKGWLKIVSQFNNSLISILLLVIWILVLSPTALIRKIFQKVKNQQIKNTNSFLKKSTKPNSDHFFRPF